MTKISRAIRYIMHGIQPRYVTANVVISNHSNRLAGKKIVVTGGGRGLGYSIAKKCKEEGGDVLIAGRNEDVLKKSAEALKCEYVVFDVTQFEMYKRFFDICENKLEGTIDCLVNNAGISLHEGTIFEVSIKTFDQQVATNFKAPYFLSKEFASRFIKDDNKKEGSILFISSERGLYCDDIPYGLIKSAINSLTKGLGRRLLGKGIRVNAIAPGVTVSDMTGYSKEGNLDRPYTSSGRVYLPEEVAELAAFLLCGESGCISSQVIPCNNGNHLRCDW